MKPADRTKLTSALREHVATIAKDLRAKVLRPGPERDKARRLHAEEQVGDDFDVWTDLLSRRAAVLWVLKSVYVRVLEDRGLLTPGRLLDPEAEHLFERLAPNLGPTAFLRWIYRDLASRRGGLPELFSPQPAEVAVPADELSRALIQFWRHRNPDTGAQWNFSEERFEGELMGDLYQELDPVVKDRFALCQTPDFVRSFILDRTLTPAIETFGADQVRLLDPSCGSGHFLIDGLKRLVAETAEMHSDWDRLKVVQHCLNRVVGIDLNDYACALARARLVMTAAELAGVAGLTDAGQFHPNVFWADGLEQVERRVASPLVGQQLALNNESLEEATRGSMTRNQVRVALTKVLVPKFQAVVGNPPYILEGDEARKAYHREVQDHRRRYVSASGKYSLASPFTERCFQLAVGDGFIGLIKSNNFMKREFGAALVKQVLRKFELTLLVDTSLACIPFHSTPTILLFGRSKCATGNPVRAVMGKRGEYTMPPNPAEGEVWTSIVKGSDLPGFENEFVSVADVPRSTLDKHPWNFGGGGVLELKEKLEALGTQRLGDLCEGIGYTTILGEDEVWLTTKVHSFRRFGIEDFCVPIVTGESVRDYAVSELLCAVYPYEGFGKPAVAALGTALNWYLWPYRTTLSNRLIFGKTLEQSGRPWYEHMYNDKNKLAVPWSITFAFVATHNHFTLDRGGRLFNRSAPAIKLVAGATEDNHLALLGLLNSSTVCFWMKQVFHDKSGGGAQLKQSDRAKVAYEFTCTGLKNLPIPQWLDQAHFGSIIVIAQQMEALATKRANALQEALPEVEAMSAQTTPSALRQLIAKAEERELGLLRLQVALQEELDWNVYALYGLVEDFHRIAPQELLSTSGSPIGSRPFELLQARAGRNLGVDNHTLFSEIPNDVAPVIRDTWEKRVRLLQSSQELALIEHESYKRRWFITPKYLTGRVETFQDRLGLRLRRLLADLVEEVAKSRDRPVTVEFFASNLQADCRFLALAEQFTGRPDFDFKVLIQAIMQEEAVPNHAFHRYTPSGLVKRAAWERTWNEQRREDAGEKITPRLPPSYTGADFLKTEYMQLRGKLDVPKERFIAFTEVPNRTDILYGWAGWTSLQRLKALLAIDEDLEDAGVPLADRAGVLDSAWSLLPWVAQEDPATANRLKAELQAVVGPDGPSRELMEEWRKRFPPPGAAKKTRKGK